MVSYRVYKITSIAVKEQARRPASVKTKCYVGWFLPNEISSGLSVISVNVFLDTGDNCLFRVLLAMYFTFAAEYIEV